MRHRPHTSLAARGAPRVRVLAAPAGAPAPLRRGLPRSGPARAPVRAGRSRRRRASLVVHDARRRARAADRAPARGALALLARAARESEIPPPDEPYGLPSTQLLRVDADSGEVTPLREPARYFDAEPDPRGERWRSGSRSTIRARAISWCSPLAARGDTPLAGSQPARSTGPRWSPDGKALVVLQTITDPERRGAETGLSFGGQEVALPRLFRVSSELRGKLELLRDGDPGGPLAPGGSLPLFWGPEGVYAQQRRGLVRCDPAGSGCKTVWAPGGKRRVVDGRSAGPGRALLLVRDHVESQGEVDLPRELVPVELNSGAGRAIYTAPRDVFLWLKSIGWTALRPTFAHARGCAAIQSEGLGLSCRAARQPTLATAKEEFSMRSIALGLVLSLSLPAMALAQEKKALDVLPDHALQGGRHDHLRPDRQAERLPAARVLDEPRVLLLRGHAARDRPHASQVRRSRRVQRDEREVQGQGQDRRGRRARRLPRRASRSKPRRSTARAIRTPA